jgi:tRNA threonylcarbamoyladenosine biosynthesis protein TsaB
MILGLDTSTPVCRVYLGANEYSWEANRTLAHGLLGYLEECLRRENKYFHDLSGLVVFRGPGSFTGLRIGITVMNTIAASESIPIVGETGTDWLAAGTKRLDNYVNDRIVLPEYGGEAHITQPKK